VVLVDTSIWISLYRRREATIGERIWMLVARNEAAVSGQISAEFLGGFRESSVRQSYGEKLGAFPFLDTTRAGYALAAEFLVLCPRLGAGDAIIAATAVTAGASLWTLDQDFTLLVPHGLTLFA
jgi:predicted nucleic acid-binding protein